METMGRTHAMAFFLHSPWAPTPRSSGGLGFPSVAVPGFEQEVCVSKPDPVKVQA